MRELVVANAQSAAALVLLALSLVALPRAYGRAARVLGVAAGSRRLAGVAVAVGAALRWLVAPHWMVTMFIGYLLTEQAIELSTTSHYGVASLALYHALFAFAPHDHRVLMWTNSVLGVLALPLWAALGARLVRDRRAGAVFGLLLAVTPLFIKNDNSDANQVPYLLWIAAGLLLLEEFLDGGEREPLVAAAPLIALAAAARPEMPLVVPLTVVAIALVAGVPRARLREPLVYVLAAAAALLVLPHVLHVATAAETLSERGSLPGWSGEGIRSTFRLLFTMNTVLTPSLYPLGLGALALVALADGRVWSPGKRVVWAALIVVTLGIYGFDLCTANMARVHVPGAIWATLLAAAGAVRLWDAAERIGVGAAAARALLVAVVAASMAPTALRLWAPTNEQTEERMIRAALARLPAQGRYTLVRMAREDRDRAAPGSEFTHHHFPDYLVRPPMGEGRVSSIIDWIDEPDVSAPAFFYLGMRCYAEFRDEGTRPPHGEHLQPACARMRAGSRLVPVVEERVKNFGDVWLDYYGDAPELTLGLYRIEPAGAP